MNFSKNLIIFTGPSGAGKATVEKYFLNDKELNLSFSVSATTRPKREREIEGKHYFFVTKEKFFEMIKNDEFVEWAEYAGNYYGTLRSEIEEKLRQGKKVFLEIEIIGAKRIIEIFPDATTIFLSPPSYYDLKQRLKKRKTETQEAIEERLRIAKIELSQVHLFKYNVINNDPREAASKIKDIIKKI